MTRRGLFGLGAASAAGVAVAAGAAPRAEGTVGDLSQGSAQFTLGAGPMTGAGGTGFSSGVVPFTGAHQAGIATPVQDRMHTAAFDLTTTDRVAVVRLLKDWTAAAARMTAGHGVGEGPIPIVAASPPDDTGEAIGLPASRLTLTVGFGPGLFEKDGADRFGLRSQRPAALIDLPHFAGDSLDPARCGGDLVVQACADDPQVAVHAIRNLARIGFGTVSVRWSQLGFGKTSSTTPAEQTPRNLFGFKDGTENIAGTEHDLLDRHVWVPGSEGPAWLAGGTYVVMRRIAMRVETWDRSPLSEQELIVGRTKGEGAPLGGGVAERDKVDVSKLPADSHVALVHPSANGGVKILRRGYSFVDGSDGLGRLDAGLFFVAFVRDPRTQYVPLQSKIARNDAMSEYLVHTGSGLWAVPPGVTGDGYWGQALLEG